MKSPEQLDRIFSASGYGQKLNSSIRFGDFKPVGVDNATWVEVLGDDVNNLRHMPHTYRLVGRFCVAHAMDKEDTRVLQTTAMTHDWGEAIIGDIADPSKTNDDEKNEEVAFRAIAEELLGRYEGEELSDIVWPVLHKDDDRLGDMFRAVEYIGYQTTAMRGGYIGRAISSRLVRMKGLDRPTTEHLAGGLLSLETALLANGSQILAEYSTKYPGIQKIIADGVPYRY